MAECGRASCAPKGSCAPLPPLLVDSHLTCCCGDGQGAEDLCRCPRRQCAPLQGLNPGSHSENVRRGTTVSVEGRRGETW